MVKSYNLEIREDEKHCAGIRFSVEEDDKEIGRAYLYIMRNDLHSRPFGLMEDVFVDESCRGKGIGTKLVKRIIEKAKEMKCYKLIATSRYSRPKVHELYGKLGFKDYGKEFRINF
jgi:GNAT superfamily N-acetyltransferase